MTEKRMAPDAAARDAERRSLQSESDGVLRGSDIEFVTDVVSAEEKAAVIATLVAQREAETERVRAVERREHEPWARSQRVPEGISGFLAEP